MRAKRYFGKYRGVVVNNMDPLNRARVQVQVPAISSLAPSTWCEPCVPLAGVQMGAYFVPQIGAGVWIEFEGGNPGHPIWTGCFWGSVADVPALALAGLPASPSIVLQTAGQNTLMISDVPGAEGGLVLKGRTGMVMITDIGITIVNEGAMISMAAGVVTITNGSATISLGPGPVVAVNGDALVVT